VKRALAVLLAVAGAGAAGCGYSGNVVRVYDGRVVEGPFVPPDAYASYLRGVLAEESGDLATALAAYTQAAESDDEDAAIWTRLGEVRCKLRPGDRAADAAFARAARLDATYAGTLAAQSRCASLRGKDDAAATLATQAAAADPGNVSLDALLVRTEARRGDALARQRAIELTLAHGERAVAWDALATWARARHDADLFARGLVGLLRSAPARSADVEAGARELLGEGHLGLARAVASAIADAPREAGVRGPRDATVARLAVDEALARGDEDAALRRATRGHVELAELAARAMILGRRDIAAHAARTVADADPGASAARMVLAALADTDRAPALTRVTDSPPPDLCALVLADRVAAVAGNDVARDWLAQVPTRKLAPHDPLGSIAVDLAARGVVAEADLPPDLRVELAARRREAPPAPPPGDVLDARHELLRRALTDPRGAEARSLFARLEGAAERDPVIAFAVARMALADQTPHEGALALVQKALLVAPGNALLLAAAVDIAKRAGKGDALVPARTRLMAVARTPAERALAGD
jgi:tetratricopeptide (TPR) repeat protein